MKKLLLALLMLSAAPVFGQYDLTMDAATADSLLTRLSRTTVLDARLPFRVKTIITLNNGADTAATIAQLRTIYVLMQSGVIDSLKSSDTLWIGLSTPAMTVDTIRYYGARSNQFTVRLEYVDSTFATAGAVLIDSLSMAGAQRRDRTSAVSGGTFTLPVGKTIRAVIPALYTMPKQFVVCLIGHRT